MLSCKDVSRKLSEAQDRKPGFGERVAVRLHLMMCAACRTMARQFKILAKISHHFTSVENDKINPDGPVLPDEAVERIRARLKEVARHSD